MIIFHADLDSTLIYSQKYDIGEEKFCVDEYSGGASYINKKTLDGIRRLSEEILIVPTTTRSKVLYERINWQGCTFKYALVANGALLLENGEIDKAWQEESVRLSKDAKDELVKAKNFLENSTKMLREAEFVEDFFLYAKAENPEIVLKELEKTVDAQKVFLQRVNQKIYIVPKVLEKGEALLRFKKYIAEKEKIEESSIKTVAAGDGHFDVSMIKNADIGYANAALQSVISCENVEFLGQNSVFSDEIIDKLSELGESC